jgi:hypothetical protein
MTSWDSGKIQIAPFLLGEERTTPLVVDVAYSPHPFDTTQPYHDVHEILEVEKPVETKPKGEFVSDEGAYKKAIKKLVALQKKTEAGDKLYYSELVQIFREYLHRRMNIYSFSKTTNDLSAQLENLNMDRDQYLQTVQALVLSDMAKYAKYQSSMQEKASAVEAIKESVMAIENIYTTNLKPQTSKL